METTQNITYEQIMTMIAENYKMIAENNKMMAENNKRSAETDRKLKHIGKICGDRQHAAIINGIRMVTNISTIQTNYQNIKNKII